MSTRSIRLASAATLAGVAVLLAGGWSRAGDVFHTAKPSTTRPATPTDRTTHPVEAVGVTVAPATRVVSEQVYVRLRGPDGQVRSYPIEGGRSAITYTNVVLSPGQSVTIRLVQAK
jgi:hypothetical protein